MAQLIGTAPNQVPTNGDLGSAAFMDSSAFYGTGLNPVFRNRIINGDMRIDQRNGGNALTVTTSSGSQVYSLDRWCHEYNSSTPTFTVQQVVDAPAGFRYSLKFTCTNASSSGQVQQIKQGIEGQNLLDLAWGTADAKPITISFWAKASIAGTYTVHTRIPGVASNYNGFVITSPNTWQYFAVTVPGNTQNPIGSYTTGEGIVIRFFMSSYGLTAGTPGVWTNSSDMVAGQVDLTRTAGASFNVTAVQVERGSQATPFEYRPIATEYAMCQRYYQTGRFVLFPFMYTNVTGSGGGTPVSNNVYMNEITLPVSMRNSGGTITPCRFDKTVISNGTYVSRTTNEGDYSGLVNSTPYLRFTEPNTVHIYVTTSNGWYPIPIFFKAEAEL